MAKKNDCWGIEVGANALKAIRLVRKGEEVSLADYDVLPFKKILTTPDVNIDEAIQINLDQFLSRHQVSKSSVVISAPRSLPGHMALARFSSLPPVEPKQVPQLIKFEAVQQIPFPIDEVEWDYHLFAQPDSPDVEVGIVAITKERVAQILSNYQAVGLEIDGLNLSPMAVYNAFAYDLELGTDSPGLIIMDIGTASTDLIIVEEGRIWLRTLPMGGNNFTEALIRAFKLSFPKAERLKREAGTSKYARQIFQAMRPVFADLLQETQKSLGYYRSIRREAKLTRLLGVGSTFRLPGMQKFLRQQLQLEVVRPDGFRRLKVEARQESDLAEHAVNLATAYGLALQGLGLEKVGTNIIPRAVIKQRIWRAKQPWFAAAAGLMLLASGAAAARLALDERRFNAGVSATDGQVKLIVADARKYVNEWNKLRDTQDPGPQIENVRSLLEYRDVWPEFLVDLELAAKALAPQEGLLTTDYTAIAAVPGPQRRRLYIESISADYKFNDPEIAEIQRAKAGGTSGTGGLGGVLGQPRTGAATPAPPAAPQEAPPAEAGPGGLVLADWGSEPSPVFTVSVIGTTPFENGPELLVNSYIKWLQENSVRLGRPYRIILHVPPKFALTPLNIEEQAATAGPPRAAMTGEMQMAPQRGVMRQPVTTRATQPTRQTSPALDRALTAPEFTRPATAPPLWRFHVIWKLQLVKPEDIRNLHGTPEVPPADQPELPTTPRAAADLREEQL